MQLRLDGKPYRIAGPNIYWLGGLPLSGIAAPTDGTDGFLESLTGLDEVS